MSILSSSVPTLHLEIQRCDTAPANLLELAPRPTGLLAWIGQEQQMVGWDEAASIECVGEHAMREASRTWSELVGKATVANHSGFAWADRAPFAISSFGFADRTPGFIAVPRTAVVRRGDETIVVTARDVASTERSELDGERGEASSSSKILPPRDLYTAPGKMTQGRWRKSIDTLLEALKVGAASKVVLTRDIVVAAGTPIDERFLAMRLLERYPTTWVFAARGLIGATPEMLAGMDGGRVHSRVLAGTASPGAGHELLDSMKNRAEHHFAVESVARALSPLAEDLNVPAEPFLLELPNVVHLATDVTATVAGANALDIADALHPTAAVCGTPTTLAFQLLEQVEGTERGRYSGPVGWIDGSGSGEFGIALRCGQLAEDRRSIRLFAGGGIMPDSIPSVELAETRAKMQPMLEALGMHDSQASDLTGAEL